MDRRSGAIVLAAAILFPPVPVQAQAQDWTTYRNVRFGTEAEYPKSVFTPGRPPDNGAGLTFTASDGASITIEGGFNPDRLSPQAFRRQFYPPESYKNVTGKDSGRDWFTLTGVNDDSIYHEKVVFSCKGDVVNILTVTYPAARKDFYAPIAARIGKSLKPGRGADGTKNCN